MALKQRNGQIPPRSRSKRQPVKTHVPVSKAKPSIPPKPPVKGNLSTVLVFGAFIIFVLAYVTHSALVWLTPSVDTMLVRMSTINEPRSVNAIIIRDEWVYTAEKDGAVEFIVQDHEWVRVDSHIASIIDPEMAHTATRHLSAVQEQAISVQNRRYATALTDTEVERLNTNLNNTINGRIHNFTTLNLSEIYSLRNDVSRVVNTRNQINISDGITARLSLTREYTRHSMALDEYSRNMYAAVSGIMSRLIDGKETVLTTDSLNSLTRYDIQEIVDYTTLTLSHEVQAGDPVFKVVGNVWYIAAYMPNDMITGFTEGMSHRFYLLNAGTGIYEPHVLRVRSIEYGTRYSLVVLRSTRHVVDFINQRNISIRTASGVQRGLKLPYTAIVTTNHYQIPNGFIHGAAERYVMLSTETGSVVIPVTIDEYNDYYSFIPVTSDIRTDSILIPRNPEHQHMLLTDAHLRVLHGVYRVSLGVAVFTPVDLRDGNIDAGYVLLDPAYNPGIREFTNIVTIASTVNAGDIIR